MPVGSKRLAELSAVEEIEPQESPVADGAAEQEADPPTTMPATITIVIPFETAAVLGPALDDWLRGRCLLAPADAAVVKGIADDLRWQTTPRVAVEVGAVAETDVELVLDPDEASA